MPTIIFYVLLRSLAVFPPHQKAATYARHTRLSVVG